METATKTSIQEKRSKLNAVSLKAKELREKLIEQADTPEKAETYAKMSINEIIVQFFYKTDKDNVFKTFKTWLKDGHAVRKGEKAFLLWGRKNQETQKPNGETQTEELEFFPITYVFSNNQVDPINR
tara:strand:- start:30192 stop:30572 length:381 start_codon:yes stop_codon:yes gene_type:complete